MGPTEKTISMTIYKEDLVNRYWAYQRTIFPAMEDYFERPYAPNGRPPVFLKHKAWKNVIAKPDVKQEEANRLLSLLPEGERHKWFHSMNSSQALAQSVFGNLTIYNHINCLAGLTDDSGKPLLGKAQVSYENFNMEYEVNYLGEPRSTSLDGFISGKYQVAIECKFTESEVGSCSRPLLRRSDSNYDSDYCDGTYVQQRGRMTKCSLTGIGVLYWNYIPQLFVWQNDADLVPCSIKKNYQLVRNILAACVRSDGSVSPENGHVVLIYDERNPAFQQGGNGFAAFEQTRNALKVPSLLRKCSWQRIINHLRHESIIPWLTEQLELKYGL